MLRHIRKGEIDTVYLCRMRHISRREGHLFSFFRQLMKHGVKVVATEYNIEYRAANFKLGRKIDTYAARHQCAKPFGRRRTVPQEQYEQARQCDITSPSC
jgi:DNA invertase Pin-like site-specific DNA recombinase